MFFSSIHCTNICFALILSLVQVKSMKWFSPEEVYSLIYLREIESQATYLNNVNKTNLHAKILGGDGECYKDSERELTKVVWSITVCTK